MQHSPTDTLTVEAGTAEQALEEITTRLGPNAEIIDARKVQKGGIAGFAKGGADDAMASFYFYKAMLKGEVAAQAEDLRQALLDLDTAKGYFVSSYPEGHEIFSLLEEIKAEWEKALSPPEPEAVAAPGAEAPLSSETPAVGNSSAEPTQSSEADAGSAASETGSEEASQTAGTP